MISENYRPYNVTIESSLLGIADFIDNEIIFKSEDLGIIRATDEEDAKKEAIRIFFNRVRWDATHVVGRKYVAEAIRIGERRGWGKYFYASNKSYAIKQMKEVVKNQMKINVTLNQRLEITEKAQKLGINALKADRIAEFLTDESE